MIVHEQREFFSGFSKKGWKKNSRDQLFLFNGAKRTKTIKIGFSMF